ncbi:hypothetical protein QBC46DRAFT_146716 [Diplogelasinospora grovesii]|uniref:Uncharacterized protein n=1 Tax=Diplogelasinospora grovesii TaxID=303347 RepID=A0AAN6S8X6_9PEZI|nr:hypothetical protein QBC46DRAFT_146716 [Diplogelasinospora grovesii]
MASEPSSTANTESTVPMPEGWTDDYKGMGGNDEWGNVNGTGAHTAVGLGLGKPTPLLGRKLEYGGGLYFFSADAKPGQLYMWEAETGDVLRVTSPATIDDIKKLISDKKMKDIKREEVEGNTLEERQAHLARFFSAQGLSSRRQG